MDQIDKSNGYLIKLNFPQQNSLINLDGSPRSDYWPRGKVWGGCSSINAMLYVRGQSDDYDDWNEIINDTQVDWSYKTCLKYFVQSENNTIPSFASNPYHGHQGG